MRTRIPIALALALATAGVAAPASAQSLERGEELYAFCAYCHGERGTGNRDYRAPALAGLPQWYVESQLAKFRAGVRGGHPEDVSGMRMRPMSMFLGGEQDVKDVAAYVASLPPADPQPVLEGGDPQRGAQLYTPCQTCHGAAGAGNQDLFAPPLVHSDDWYQLEQLRKFKAGIRGADPRDTSGALMRPMSMTLADEQAMLDVLAHISTLGEP